MFLRDSRKIQASLPPFCFQKTIFGFTLAELLISLAIFGMVATIVIPKIITAQQNTQYTARAKEVISSVSAAFQQYQANNVSVPSTLGIKDLTPYMNYISRDSTTTIDDIPVYTTVSCANGSFVCLRMHNGSTMLYRPTENFGGSSATNGVLVLLDPDGVASANKSIDFMLRYTGRIISLGTCDATTFSSQFAYPCSSTWDPSWFQW